MAQIPVAMLDIDEAKPRLPCPHPSGHEIFHQRIELVIAKDRLIGNNTHPGIENRMPVGDSRRRLALGVGETTRVGQLEPHDEIIRAPEALCMALHQLAAQ